MVWERANKASFKQTRLTILSVASSIMGEKYQHYITFTVYETPIYIFSYTIQTKAAITVMVNLWNTSGTVLTDKCWLGPLTTSHCLVGQVLSALLLPFVGVQGVVAFVAVVVVGR